MNVPLKHAPPRILITAPHTRRDMLMFDKDMIWCIMNEKIPSADTRTNLVRHTSDGFGGCDIALEREDSDVGVCGWWNE